MIRLLMLTKRLRGNVSALAKRQIDPTFIHIPHSVETFGPEVAELAARVGMEPDPLQETILDGTFAILPSGKSAAFEVDIVGPRQVMGKTGTLKMIHLGWLYVTKERLSIHSAHELSTTEETFRETAALVEDHPFLSRHLLPTRGDRPGITAANGRWAIELKGDRRLRYKARQATGGRGLTGNKLSLDEFFAVTSAMIGSLYPTLAAVPNPQVVTASSGGLLISEALREKRARGRVGATPNQFYLECCDADWSTGEPVTDPLPPCLDPRCSHAKTAVGCRLDDELVWERIMSALDTRVSRATVRSLRQAMPPAEFAREFMVWWEDPPTDAANQIYGAHWSRQGIPDAQVPKPRCLGVAAEWEHKASSVAAFGDYGDDAIGIVFPATSDPALGGTRPGTSWVVDEVVDIANRHNIPVAVAAKGPGAVFVEPLQAALGSNRVLVASMDDLKDAYAAFNEGVTETHTLFHNDATELNAGVQCAKPRMSGDRPLLGRTQSDGDVSIVEAAHLAAWGATAHESKRRTPMASFA
jgi:hypothetical protein